MLQDLKFAFRLLSRQRGFAVVAILTIALGVGLSATVFAVVDGVLFRQLPYKDPSRLVVVYAAVRADGDFTMPVSVPDLLDWRASSRTLGQFEGYDISGLQARIRNGDETVQSPAGRVTAGFLDLLGAQPAIGRGFSPNDFEPSAAPVAVIGEAVWRRIFASDPAVLGRTLTVGATEHTIVGVLSRGFVFPTPSKRFAPEVLLPFQVRAVADGPSSYLFLIGRLADGASLKQAQTEMDAIAVRLKPIVDGRPKVRPDGVTLMDLRDQMTMSSRGVLWLTFGAVAAVFLIACVNVVGLLAAQAEDRRRELAVRLAIGASRAALLRQLLTESAVIAGSGAVAGWLVSQYSFAALATRIPARLQLLGEPRLGARAALFGLILAVITLAVAGVVPALRASGGAPRDAMATGGRAVSGSRRGRHALILAQVALATVLICAGSIMFRSWVTLHTQDSGMDADRLIAVRALPARLTNALERARQNNVIADAVRRVGAVRDVALIDMPLLQSAIRGSTFHIAGQTRERGGMETDLRVSPGYFQVVGIPIVAGRALTDGDRGRGIVISETLARRYWPGRHPVGETVQYGAAGREIVGVAADARDVSFDRDPTPTLYHVWDDAEAPTATIVARFDGSAERALDEIRRSVRAADPNAVISMLSTVEDLQSLSVAPRTFNTLLFVVFAASGLLVALVGIYGLVAFLVARREREMGIRLALGATGHRLKWFVMAGTVRWVAGGLVLGLGGSLLLAQYLKPFVYQIPANDPLTLAIACGGFLAVAALAAYLPARRAARVDPMVALRTE